jgi:hypothetical protein
LTKEVKTVTPLLPPEVSSGIGIPHMQMLPINDGSELLLYGDNSNIWKYAVANNKWDIRANILISRWKPLVIKAPKLYCP